MSYYKNKICVFNEYLIFRKASRKVSQRPNLSQFLVCNRNYFISERMKLSKPQFMFGRASEKFANEATQSADNKFIIVCELCEFIRWGIIWEPF